MFPVFGVEMKNWKDILFINTRIKIINRSIEIQAFCIDGSKSIILRFAESSSPLSSSPLSIIIKPTKCPLK